jgi:hypothetical protein
LTVEIDPALITLVVRDGYSPHFGARPLKRTVERLLLLPVARAISSGSLRGRTILRLTARENKVEAVITGPAIAKTPAVKEKRDESNSLTQRLETLARSYEQVDPAVRPLMDRKSELVLRTTDAKFYSDAENRIATFDEIHKLEQFLTLHSGLGKALLGLKTRFKREVSLKDTRTGRTTTRVDKVLKGELGPLLQADDVG